MTLLKPSEVLRWLHGEWTLSRDAPGCAAIRGHATFLPVADHIAAYHETVSVQLLSVQPLDHARSLHAEQSYEYRQTELGLAVFFASPSPEAGALFHVLDFCVDGRELRARAHHKCRDDLYLSEYALPIDSRADTFTVRHDVEGPRKSYSLLSTYIREQKAPEHCP